MSPIFTAHLHINYSWTPEIWLTLRINCWKRRLTTFGDSFTRSAHATTNAELDSFVTASASIMWSDCKGLFTAHELNWTAARELYWKARVPNSSSVYVLWASLIILVGNICDGQRAVSKIRVLINVPEGCTLIFFEYTQISYNAHHVP